MKKRYIEMSELPNFEVTVTNGRKFILFPYEHLYDIPEVDVEEIVREHWEHIKIAKTIKDDIVKECLEKIEQIDTSESDDYIVIKKINLII